MLLLLLTTPLLLISSDYVAALTDDAYEEPFLLAGLLLCCRRFFSSSQCMPLFCVGVVCFDGCFSCVVPAISSSSSIAMDCNAWHHLLVAVISAGRAPTYLPPLKHQDDVITRCQRDGEMVRWHHWRGRIIGGELDTATFVYVFLFF